MGGDRRRSSHRALRLWLRAAPGGQWPSTPQAELLRSYWADSSAGLECSGELVRPSAHPRPSVSDFPRGHWSDIAGILRGQHEWPHSGSASRTRGMGASLARGVQQLKRQRGSVRQPRRPQRKKVAPRASVTCCMFLQLAQNCRGSMTAAPPSSVRACPSSLRILPSPAGDVRVVSGKSRWRTRSGVRPLRRNSTHRRPPGLRPPAGWPR